MTDVYVSESLSAARLCPALVPMFTTGLQLWHGHKETCDNYGSFVLSSKTAPRTWKTRQYAIKALLQIVFVTRK